ncbi:anti-sigma-I factor RsgI6-like [Watersipora subatra]|uniref:anti-sigma-I factor RsgI6-like n=1 Tax=Watersipora subatra TaxID=2589382 RepID=UPI00355BA796
MCSWTFFVNAKLGASLVAVSATKQISDKYGDESINAKDSDDCELKGSRDNLLGNADFELPIGGPDNWFATKCTATPYTKDVVSGNFSLRISDMTLSYGSVRYSTLNLLQPGKRYFLSGWVKVLNSEADVTTMNLVHLYRLDKGVDGKVSQLRTLDTVVYEVGTDGWVKLSAEFEKEDFSDPVFANVIYIVPYQTTPYPEYLIDDFSLVEMVDDPAWKTKAIDRNNAERKTNVTIRLNVSKNQKDYYSRMRLTLQQKAGYFGIGTKVDSFLLNTHDNYRKTVEDNFEWVTLGTDLSWKRTEYSQFELTWEDSDAGMKLLQKMNKKVRGGSIHEGAYSLQPDFVKTMVVEDDIYRSSMKRIDDLVGRYRYQFGGPENESSAMQIFHRWNLFVITGHKALRRLVNRMKTQGVPISGIGAEANFGENFPAPHLINHRFTQLSELGLPIWLTGFSCSHADPAVRAAFFEDLIDIALSHPSVEGIMLNEFWDGHQETGNTSLFDGSDHLPNDAGLALQRRSSDLSNWVRAEEISVVPSEKRNMDPQILYPGQYTLIVEYFKDSTWKRLRSYDNLNVRKDKENQDGTMIINAYF